MKKITVRVSIMGIFCLIISTMAIAQQSENQTKLSMAMQYQLLQNESNENSYLDEMVHLDLMNATIGEALNYLAIKADLRLMFSEEDLPESSKVTIEDKYTTIKDALWLIFDGTDLRFAVSPNRQLVVMKDSEFKNQPITTTNQEIIRGTVFDSRTMEALPGVNVIVKDTSIGTATDVNGEFELEVPSLDATLVVSYIGYLVQEVPIDGRSVLNIELQVATISGEEIVVVGYGTQREKEVTSSISRLSVEDFNQGSINDTAELMQGKIPGLSISRPGGNPNEEYVIRLRGLSTIGANTQPLVVIDGVPGASLNSLDPNDIESIDVLKDGSAAAIYGTRGSSGVILITTKRGTAGEFRVSYSGTFAANTVANTVPVMDSQQFRDFGGGLDLGSSTNWFDEITQTGITHTNNLSFSGGAGRTAYRASINYRDSQGIAVNTGFSQINGRLNLNQTALEDRLRLNLIISSTTREADKGFDAAFRYATIFNPTAPIRSAESTFDQYDGYFQQVVFDMFNPVAILEQNINEEKTDRFNVSLKADYDLLDQLSVSGFYAREKINRLGGEYYHSKSFWVGMNRRGLARRSNNDSLNQLFELTSNYTNSFEALNLDLLGGYSYQEFYNEGFFAEGGNFISDAFQFNNLAASIDFTDGLGSVTSYANTNKLVAFFGRANFNLRDIYFISTSIRHESSTRFGAENKWGTFPAVSAGVMLNELFDIPRVQILKLRASYGVTGNDAPASYLSRLRYGPQSGQFYLSGSDYLPSYGPVSNPNPNLKWEVKNEFDIGVDFEILEGRISGSADYYWRTTNDLLLEFGVPVPPNLFDRTWVNIGELKNNGFELALDYLAVQRSDFSWRMTGTYSSFNTELVSLSNEDLSFGSFRLLGQLGSPGLATNTIRVEEGQPLGIIWGHIYEGIDADGRWVLRDLNGDGVIDESDRTQIGNAMPDFQVGFSNNLNYKQFDMSLFFRGVFGHDLVNSFRAFYENPTVITSYNILESTRDISNLREAPQFSSFHVEKASFLRLQYATIGYNVTPDRLPVSNMRVSFSAQNLFTITNYKGVDPEVRFDDNGDPLAPGIDRRNTWFNTRTFSLGLNIDF